MKQRVLGLVVALAILSVLAPTPGFAQTEGRSTALSPTLGVVFCPGLPSW